MFEELQELRGSRGGGIREKRGRGARGRCFVLEDSRKSRSYAYLRPNLLYTRKFVIVHSTFSASSEE
jgi:hypothetical protein